MHRGADEPAGKELFAAQALPRIGSGTAAKVRDYLIVTVEQRHACAEIRHYCFAVIPNTKGCGRLVPPMNPMCLWS
jgi:hypothetical protein